MILKIPKQEEQNIDQQMSKAQRVCKKMTSQKQLKSQQQAAKQMQQMAEKMEQKNQEGEETAKQR